jgi:hypothetical protein
MIRAEDALAFEKVRAMARVQPKKVALTDDEALAADFLEATIETSIRKEFTGKIFDINIPIKFASEGILAELERRCVEAGWQVSMVRSPTDPNAFRIVFAAGKPPVDDGTPGTIAHKGLPPLPSVPVMLAGKPPRILIRMPTRGRPAQALVALEKYRRMAGMPVLIEVVVDHDDAEMLSAEVMQRLAALECVVTVGHHGSKIEACNGGRVDDWDILVLASDDMMPVADNYAVRIAAAMQEHFPHFDGALHTNDGYQKAQLCTLPIMGRRLWAQFGYVYNYAYQSLFCDREYTDLLKGMGRLAYVDEKLIEHRHHVWGWGEKDALYERNDALESADKVVFEHRAALRHENAQWAFNSPPMQLSILICTLPSRRAQLEWLLEHLYQQVINDTPCRVEILVDDRRGISVGMKRQALLERARGRYISFVDDDDIVPHNYCRRVVDELTYTDVDSVSLEGVMTTDGQKPQRFIHSMHVEEWHTKDGVFMRNSNHLNPVRRELALQAGFGDENCGEDHSYSKRLKPLVKTEADMGEAPLYFYAFRPSASVQAGAK